jgi:AraC family transcriptional regulator of adaptative response / DNA-3-methyladenine glycosylase II
VFMATDLGVRRGLQQLGFTGGLSDIEKLANGWRPWRSYALAHIWAAASPTTLTTRRPAQQLREEKSA